MATIEEMIQKAGKTAPRITPADVEAAIAETHYFNASDAAHTADYKHPALALLTICVLVLKNGFTVVGKSACASPENYDKAIGEKVARDDALRQVWPLLGYALREKLAGNTLAVGDSIEASVTKARP